MRSILSKLSSARSQKLEVCYNSVECEDPVNELLARGPGIAADILDDACRNNQIMYGHGLRPNFAEYHRMPVENALWVAVIREPMTWAVSMYKQFYKAQAYTASFEQWVQDGRSNSTSQALYLYFLDPYHPSNSIEKRAQDWMESGRVLTLFTEDYANGLSKFAQFLGATSGEESAMIRALQNTHSNVRPDGQYNVTLSRASMKLLQKHLEPAYSVYNVALKTSAAPGRHRRKPSIRQSDQNPHMIDIQVNLGWWDAEE